MSRKTIFSPKNIAFGKPHAPVADRGHDRPQRGVQEGVPRPLRQYRGRRPDPPVHHQGGQHVGVEQGGEVVVEVEHPPHRPEGDVVQGPAQEEPQAGGQKTRILSRNLKKK